MTYKPTAGDPLSEIAQIQQQVAESREKLASLVLSARSFGATWLDVGAALGISRQSAHLKYARLEHLPLSDSEFDALFDTPQE